MVPVDEGGWMRFDPAKPPPRWGLPDLLIGIGLGLLTSLVVSVLVAFATGEATSLAEGTTEGAAATIVAGLLGQWLGMLGWLWHCSRHKGQGTFRDDFGLRWQGWREVAIGIAVGIGAILAAGLVISVVAALFGSEPGSNTDDILESAGSDAGMVVLALCASFGAPVVEEVFFRGLGLRAAERRLGAVLGVVVSTAVFAVLHLQGGTPGESVSLLAGIFTLGVVFAVVARWRAGLVAAICAHVTVNLTSSIVFLSSALGG